MEDPVVVLCTCANREEAARIARALVEQRLAACVQALGPMESTYWWKGKLETSAEVLLLIKSFHGQFSELCNRIQMLHSYEVPEIVALPATAVSEKYLAWMRSEIIA